MQFKTTIIRQLAGGFIVVALLLIVMGLVALREVNDLANLTEKMYLHPLTVSNAVLEANSNIIAMHRHMKDVVLARTEQDLEEAVRKVDADEQRVYQHFDIVFERFLGDKSRIEEAHQAFADWKAIRAEVIELTLAKKYNEAAAITKGKGAEHVAMMTGQMNGLIDFARNKATEFRSSSQRVYAQSLTDLRLLMGILLLALGLTGAFVVYHVKKAQRELETNEEKYRNLYNTMAQGVVYQDGSGRIVSANSAAEEILGIPHERLLNEESFCPGCQAIGEDGEAIPSETQPPMRALRSGKEVSNAVMGVYHAADQCYRWIMVSSIPQIRPGENRPHQVYSTFTDITGRKHAEEEQRILSRAVEASSSAVIIAGSDGKIQYVNPKFNEITGYSREDVIGCTPRLLQSGETPNNAYQDMWKTVVSGEEWKGEFHNCKKDGSLYWARNSISGVKDSTGRLTHVISIQDDVTHEYEMTEQLSYQATHDNLTGLINRREFERRTERILLGATGDGEEHALCFMDLDQFKVINDTCGHMAGDELLRQLGRVFRETVRKRDTLARLGGDEFGVLMEHCTLEQAQRVANLLLNSVQDYQFSWQGQSFRVGVSIGLVPVGESSQNLTELLKQADAACYMAKDQGRNRIHVYNPEDIELAQRQGEMQWFPRIQQALELDRFCLYAQPIVPLACKQDTHYELLLRMVDEAGNTIPPGAFLTAAERYNFIERLDAWVIEQAFSLLAAYPDFVDKTRFVTINLSAASLTNARFLDIITSQFETCGIEPEKICFEVTETAAISNLSKAVTFIYTLRGMGCRFALDDFGSGLSSFGYLKNLPVEFLKIDGMFVKDVVDDPIDHAMVRSINDIGHVMGMKTIAEFVENDVVMDMLREIGVDYGQGYGIGKPEAFDRLLQNTVLEPARKCL